MKSNNRKAYDIGAYTIHVKVHLLWAVNWPPADGARASFNIQPHRPVDKYHGVTGEMCGCAV